MPQEQVFKTRAAVNEKAGTRRMMAHFTFTPGWDGWLDKVDEAIEKYKPDSWKGYTVGDNTHKESAQHPWHADDEKLMYPFYEKIAKTGIRNVCIHKGLFSPGGRREIPASAAVCRCQRYRQGGEGLAAAQLPRLPLGLSLGRRQPG